MRITYISSLEKGGPVSHLLGLAPLVAAAGAEVTVLCQSRGVATRLARCGVDAQVVPLRAKNDLRGAIALLPRIRGSDIVHTQDRRALLLGGVLARAVGSHMVHTYHGVPDELVELPGQRGGRVRGSTWRGRWSRHGHLRLESGLIRLGSVITPSRAMRDFLVDNGFPPARVSVVPSRIDVRRTAPPAPRTPLCLAVVGELVRNKGVDVLIRACARARSAVRLEVFGGGPEGPALERAASMLSVAATFHGPVDDVRRRLEGVDVLVQPSRGENLPMAVLEAMAAALPVIASGVGGVPELVVDGSTGLLVEPGDEAGLAGAIDTLANDHDRCVAMGRAGAARIAARFDSAIAGAEMHDIYRRVCASSM